MAEFINMNRVYKLDLVQIISAQCSRELEWSSPVSLCLWLVLALQCPLLGTGNSEPFKGCSLETLLKASAIPFGGFSFPQAKGESSQMFKSGASAVTQ